MSPMSSGQVLLGMHWHASCAMWPFERWRGIRLTWWNEVLPLLPDLTWITTCWIQRWKDADQGEIQLSPTKTLQAMNLLSMYTLNWGIMFSFQKIFSADFWSKKLQNDNSNITLWRARSEITRKFEFKYHFYFLVRLPCCCSYIGNFHI